MKIDTMEPITVANLRAMFGTYALTDVNHARETIRHGRTVANLYGRTGWVEVEALPRTVCSYGCKLYARRHGCVTVFATFHSSTYGHGK